MTLVFASALSFLGFVGSDPAPSLFRKRDVARSLECERLARSTAEIERAGEVKRERPRGSFGEREVLLCRQRLVREGIRQPRDEAILRDLESRVSRVAKQVASVRADLAERTWLVEAFTPDVRVGAKVTFALKAALMRESLRVSDRLPLLSAGDIEVITRLPPTEAYAVACRRWHDTGQLRPTDVLVAQITRDPRETNLHTGLCIDGRWSWLR